MLAKQFVVDPKSGWWLAACTTAGLLIVAVLMGGCSETGTPATQGVVAPQSETLSTASAMEPPTWAEVSTPLNLRPEQEEQMRAALEAWRGAAAECRGPRPDRGPGGHGGRRGAGCPDPDQGAHRAVMTFLVQTAAFLDTDQYVGLIGLVADRTADYVAELQRERAGRRPAGMGGPQIGGLLRELDPTEEQKAAIRQARLAQREAMQALHEEAAGGENTPELRQRMQELREQFQEALRDILTAEQYARWEELRAARRREMLERRRERLNDPDERRMEFLATVLKLTAEQREQIAAIHAAARDRQRAVMEGLQDGSLTRAEAREQHITIREETHAAVRELLTPEQQEILDALSQLHGGFGRHGGFGGGPGLHGWD